MTPLGSIIKLQKHGMQFYAELAQIFSVNNLIHATWRLLSQDLNQQASSLQALPHSFWNRLKGDEEALRESIRNCWTPESIETEKNRTLQHFFSRALDFEEPLILKVYVPLIRRLRAEWSGQVLDLYIMVKAHVSRLLQVIRSFSGDPVSIQRVTSLFYSFEKEVQVPQELVAYRSKLAAAPIPAERIGQPKKSCKPVSKPTAASRRSRMLEKRSKIIPKRSKPLVKVSRRALR